MKQEKIKYVVRHFADCYWIVAVNQKGAEYIPPVLLNESGAFLWQCYRSGESMEEAAQKLAEKYGIDLRQARNDTKNFWQQEQEK